MGVQYVNVDSILYPIQSVSDGHGRAGDALISVQSSVVEL